MPKQQLENIELACPECKSTNLMKSGKRHINRKEVQQWQCRGCWRITIHPIEITPNPRASGDKEER